MILKLSSQFLVTFNSLVLRNDYTDFARIHLISGNLHLTGKLE